jgi:hypothetical protein
MLVRAETQGAVLVGESTGILVGFIAGLAGRRIAAQLLKAIDLAFSGPRNRALAYQLTRGKQVCTGVSRTCGLCSLCNSLRKDDRGAKLTASASAERRPSICARERCSDQVT